MGIKLTVEPFARESMLVRIVRYDPTVFERCQKISGAQFINEAKGGPGFKFSKDMTTCKRLREAFGREIHFSDEIMEWGRAKEEERKRLTELSLAGGADDETLARVREHLPEMYPLLRPYQKAGIRFIAEAPSPLVADDMGLGKTWQAIGGVFQAGLDTGPNLIVCPKISIENVWLAELSRFQQNCIFVAPEGRHQREKLLEEVEFALEVEEPFWLVINPAMLTFRRSRNEGGVYDARSGMWFDTQFPFIAKTHWNTIILDEAHLTGIANPSTQTARSISQLRVRKRIALTGTPAGGKAERMWGILHWLDPKEFTSRTRWNDQWLHKLEFYDSQGQVRERYDKLETSHEAAFYKAHAQYILRRTIEEVYTELPPATEITVTVKMGDKQREQYRLMQFEADARITELMDERGKVSSPNVLTTYSWLKQFANAYCDVVKSHEVFDETTDQWIPKYKAYPTEDSPKLEAVMQILNELGVPDSEEQCVIFTQFVGMANMVHKYLTGKGIPTDIITGAVTSRVKRSEIASAWQQGTGAKVLVMSTRAGGVSINLDRANTLIFLDETWDPDDRKQAIGRLRRMSRVHHVTAYTIRTKGTIETQIIAKRLEQKAQINDVLLDLYRRRLTGEEE